MFDTLLRTAWLSSLLSNVSSGIHLHAVLPITAAAFPDMRLVQASIRQVVPCV